MTTEQLVFNQLFKTELATQKVELALTDDLKKNNSDLKKYIDELTIAKQNYILQYSISEELVNKFKNVAVELGLDPLKNTDYSSIKSLLSNKIK
jgi:hypothetical protein